MKELLKSALETLDNAQGETKSDRRRISFASENIQLSLSDLEKIIKTLELLDDHFSDASLWHDADETSRMKGLVKDAISYI